MFTQNRSHMKFEVLLPMDEARRVLEDMKLRNCRKKADHVRRCLLSRSAVWDDELSFQLGAFTCAVNELLHLIREGGATGAPELQRLSSHLSSLVKDVSRRLNTRGFL